MFPTKKPFAAQRRLVITGFQTQKQPLWARSTPPMQTQHSQDDVVGIKVTAEEMVILNPWPRHGHLLSFSVLMATLPDDALERAAPLLNLLSKGTSAQIQVILGSGCLRIPVCIFTDKHPFSQPMSITASHAR